MKKKKKRRLPDIPPLPEEITQAFPGGFTLRDEANALTAYAFRNGMIEELHAGTYSPLLEDPKLSRITDEEMKAIMMEVSSKLALLLKIRDAQPVTYQRMMQGYGYLCCRGWNR
jgi:hypothetical protein